MRKYRITIIDDQNSTQNGNRKEIYNSVLSNYFELSFMDDASQMKHILQQKKDAYIIDLFLEEYWVITIDSILMKLETNIPIFLISSKWEHPKKILTKLNIENLSKTSVYFFSYADFVNATQSINDRNKIINIIQYNLNCFFNRFEFDANEDDDLILLHLSDLHFGDPNIDGSSNFLEYNLSDFVCSNDIVPNLIVISGDITYSGKKEEYIEAKGSIDKLCKKLWDTNDDFNRVIFTNGNHDFDYSLLSSNRYKFDFSNFDFKPIEYNTDYTFLSHYYYNNLISKYVNPNILSLEKKLNYIDDRFLNYGLRFWCLNSVDIGIDKQNRTLYKKQFNLSSLIELRENSEPTDNDILNVVVAHHSPWAIGFSQAVEDSPAWKDFRGFLDTIKAKLYLSGHSHSSFSNILNDPKLTHARHCIVSRSSSLRLNRRKLDSEGHRGFNIIKISKDNGIAKEIEILSYKIDGNKIELDSSSPYKIR